MANAEPPVTRTFWTFVVRGLTTDGATALVRGWFVVCRVRSIDDPEERSLLRFDQYLTFEYLTPHDQPVELDVTAFVAAGTKVDDLSPRTIVTALSALFVHPFQPIPPAPTSLPLHRLPPSQRTKMKAAVDGRNQSAFDHPFGQRPS